MSKNVEAEVNRWVTKILIEHHSLPPDQVSRLVAMNMLSEDNERLRKEVFDTRVVNEDLRKTIRALNRQLKSYRHELGEVKS